jgi:hypothetical protein
MIAGALGKSAYVAFEESGDCKCPVERQRKVVRTWNRSEAHLETSRVGEANVAAK